MSKVKLAESFVAWMKTQDELAVTALSIGAEFTTDEESMLRLGELMAVCFGAGRLSAIQDQTRDMLAASVTTGGAN